MPINSNDFSAFDEALKKAQPSVSQKEDEFAAFDQALKKKEPSEPSSKGLQAGVSDGIISTIEPPKNAIDLSFDAFNLENQKITRRAPATIGFGTGGGEVVTVEEDPQAKAASKKIKEDLRAQGYDADKLYDDFKDINELLQISDGQFTKDKLLKEYKENPQQYEKDVATLKLTSFANKAASKLPAEQISNLDINISPANTYQETRAKYKDITDRIKEYGGEYEKELLKNFSIAVGGNYGAILEDPAKVKQDERSKYLNEYQIAALQYLEDTNPDAAKGYGSMLVDPNLIKKGTAEEAGWQEKASSLEQIGLQLYKGHIESQISDLNDRAKTSPLSIQDAALAKELETKLTDVDNKIREINIKYPIPAEKEAKEAAMDLTDNAMSNALTRPFLSIGNAIDNTWKGIYDFAREPFSNDEQSKLYQLAAAGESVGKDIQMYLPKKRTTLQNYDWQMSSEVSSQYKKIMDDASISKDEKTRRVYDLLQKNPDGFARIPIVGGKTNITPTSLYYSVVDLGASLVPYLALESLTAGGATAGIVRKLASSFMAAAATGFHDNYVIAVREGAANPYREALITTGIMSGAMAGAGTAQMIKAMYGTKTAVGELINKMTDAEITKVLDKIKNGTLKNRILDYGKTLGKDAVKSITEGAKGGAKFEGIMSIAKGIELKRKGQDINPEELFKEGAIGVLNFTAFGGVMGIGKSAWKNVTDFQGSTLLKASQNPTEYLKAAAKSLADGTITNKDYNQIKSNIELASKVSEGIKFIDDKGVELPESKKAKLLLAKMQEAKLNEDAQGDIPSKLKEDLDNQIGEVKTEIGKIQESEEEAGVSEDLEKTIPELKATTDNLKEAIKAGGEDAGQAQLDLELIKKDPVAYYEKLKEEYKKSTEGKDIPQEEIDATIKSYDDLINKVKEAKAIKIPEVLQAELPKVEEKPTKISAEKELDKNKELVAAFPNALELNDKGELVERGVKEGESEFEWLSRGILGYYEQYLDAIKNDTTPKELDSEKLKFLKEKYKEGKIKSLVDVFTWSNKKSREIHEKYESLSAGEEVTPKAEAELPPTPEKVTPEVEEEITPMEVEEEQPPFVEGGRTVVTLSGLTEEGRQKAIAQRNKELKITDRVKDEQAILDIIERYNSLKKGRLGQQAPIGLDLLNKIRNKVGEFNQKYNADYEFGRATLLNDKNRTVKRKTLKDRDAEIDESGKSLRDRDLKTQEVFDDLFQEGALPTGYTGDKMRMSESQLNATIQDILDGVPSRRANNYLDALEKQIREDDFDFSKSDDMPAYMRPQIKLDDVLGVSREEATEPMTEDMLNDWLSKESEITPENQQVYDNIENLITYHETRNEPEGEVRPTPTPTKERVAEPTKPVTKEEKPSGKVAAEKPTAEKVEPKAELPKEEVKEYNSKNLPNPIGEFEVVSVIPYTTIDKNKFTPDQQLKFNQGDKYEPVRIVGDSELIELIQIGSRLRSNLTSSIKKPINRERQKALEDKYGIKAYEASERARELAKQNRGDVENIIIIGEKPIEKAAKKAEPKAELPSEVKEEKTALQKASEARRAAKAKLDSLRKGLGINEQAKLEALVDYHRTLVAEAKEFIKEKADDINEWAKSIGEKVNIVLQKAWDEAKGAKPVEKAEDLGYGIEDVEIKKVGLSKAEIAKQVEEFGMMQPSRRAKITDAELDQMADDAINAGYNVQKLIDRLRIESTKPLEERQSANDLEVTILNQYAAALNAEQTINPSKETLKKYAEALDAARKAFSITGATLRQAQRSQMVVDNLSNFLVDKENAQGAPLTEKQLKEETAKFQELKAAKDALEQALKEEKEKNEKLIAEIGFNKAKALRKREAKKTNEEYKAERKAILDAAKEALQSIPKGGELYSTIPGLPQSIKKLQQLKTIAPFVKEYMGTLINQGVDKLDNVVTDIHAEFKDVVEGVTKNDILKIIAGVYDTPTSTRNEAASKKRLLEREAKLLNELAAARKGEEVAKTEKERIQKSRRIQELERQIKETRELNREDAEPIEKTNAERLAAREKQLLRKIEKLNQDLKSGNFLQEKKPLPPLEINPKTRALMNKVIELEEKIRAERAKDEYDKKPKWVKNLDKVSQVLGVRRLMQTAFDLSVSFRQGATLFSPRNIKIWAKSFKNEISSITPERFKKLMYEIRHSESYHEMVEDGVVFNDLGTVNEDYLNANFMQNIPGIGQGLRASQRAADGFLNTARYELYQKFRKNLERQGLTRQSDPQAYKEMASWVMAMTGRGNMIKALENPNAQQILGNTFYGARLMASRFQLLNLPSYLLPAAGVGSKFRNKEMARESLKDMASWAGTVMAVGAALAATPGAKISLNPDDSDFLQVRYGDKVYDISGGTAAYIRTFLRITQALIARTTRPKYIGKKKVEKASESTLKFFRNKLAPNTSYATDAIFGGSSGREFDPYAILKTYPMYGDDLIEGLEDEGVVSLATILLPNLIGIGLNTYSAKGTVEDDLDTLVRNSQTADDQNPESIKNYNKGGVPVTDEEFDKYIDKANKLIGEDVTKFYKNGKNIVNEDGVIVKKSYLELSPDEIANEIKSIKQKATKKAQEELFGVKSLEEKVEEKMERARKRIEKIANQ